MSNPAQTAAANPNRPKRERKPAAPPTKLEAVAKIGKILKGFDPGQRAAILAFVAEG